MPADPSPPSPFVLKSERGRHEIFPGVTVHTAAGQAMMLSLAEIDPGAEVQWHSHPHEQVGMVVQGQARFQVGDAEQVLGPGDMYRIPGGVRHRVVALSEGCAALDIFHPVREDYL